MPRAEILLEDSETEGAHVRFVFPDGFDAKSPSHQMCNIIRSQLDDLAAEGVLKSLPIEGDAVDALVDSAKL